LHHPALPAQDIGELEVAVGQNLWPLEHLGPPFRLLRAFRRLLFLETPDVGGSPLLLELPASVALHHLYSRAPLGLQSPLTRSGLSAAQVRNRERAHSRSACWGQRGQGPSAAFGLVAGFP
jgi:hypothetical protein